MSVSEVDMPLSVATAVERLGDEVALPRAEIGDLIVLYQSGALA
jgi:hypothetical protein